MFLNLFFRQWLALSTLCVISCVPTIAQVDSVPVATIDSGSISGAHFGPSAAGSHVPWHPLRRSSHGRSSMETSRSGGRLEGHSQGRCFRARLPTTGRFRAGNGRASQRILTDIPYFKDFRTDEDCLYINVWTTNLGGKQKAPVMVFLHGGAGVGGNSWIPPLGPALARKGVVLGVSSFGLACWEIWRIRR